MTIPPDEDSCVQHILRAHYITHIWRNYHIPIIPRISLLGNGWKIDDDNEVVPVWFTGSQLPPSCIKTRKKKRICDGSEADIEFVPVNKNKNRNIKTRSQKRSVAKEKSVDDEEVEDKRRKLEKEKLGRLFRKNLGDTTKEDENDSYSSENGKINKSSEERILI